LRSLAAIEEAILRLALGLVFDVDDTITREGRLEPEAFAALWALHRAGLRLIAVTGRPLGWADVFARQWPIDVAVGENGAGWIWMEAGRAREGHFEGSEARALGQARLSRIRARVGEALPEIILADDQRARRADLAFDIGERASLEPETIAHLISLIEGEGARALVSSVHCHAIPGAWDKALGVERAHLEVFSAPLDRDRWLFIGDSGNDAAAFATFPHSIGVANVRAQLHRLPQAPAFITVADRGRGFAELARALLAARGAPAAGG